MICHLRSIARFSIVLTHLKGATSFLNTPWVVLLLKTDLSRLKSRPNMRWAETHFALEITKAFHRNKLPGRKMSLPCNISIAVQGTEETCLQSLEADSWRSLEQTTLLRTISRSRSEIPQLVLQSRGSKAKSFKLGPWWRHVRLSMAIWWWWWWWLCWWSSLWLLTRRANIPWDLTAVLTVNCRENVGRCLKMLMQCKALWRTGKTVLQRSLHYALYWDQGIETKSTLGVRSSRICKHSHSHPCFRIDAVIKPHSLLSWPCAWAIGPIWKTT